jgi:hypothetical protein
MSVLVCSQIFHQARTIWPCSKWRGEPARTGRGVELLLFPFLGCPSVWKAVTACAAALSDAFAGLSPVASFFLSAGRGEPVREPARDPARETTRDAGADAAPVARGVDAPLAAGRGEASREAAREVVREPAERCVDRREGAALAGRGDSAREGAAA